MKKQIALILVIGFAVLFSANHQIAESKKQNKIFPELTPKSSKAVAFAVSPKVSSFAPAQPEDGKTSKKMGSAEEQAKAVPNKEPFRKQIEGAPHDTDANLANLTSAQPIPSPNVSFEGLNSNDNATAYGFRIIPPDPNGDVGLDHYVQAVNALVRVYEQRTELLSLRLLN